MLFKDRKDAGEKLSEILLKDKDLLKEKKNVVVVSLLRGGNIVGETIAQKLKIKNIPLAVTKIGSPLDPDLAIGAICLAKIYLQKNIVSRLGLKKETIDLQTAMAKFKHYRYLKKFGIQKINYEKKLCKKIVLIVDDGIATGATVKAAFLFVKSKKPKKIILAVPVAPVDFDSKEFDKTYILQKDAFLSSVSQFYEVFPQGEAI